MADNEKLAQIICASHYVVVGLLFAAESHGLQMRSQMLQWLRLFADFLEKEKTRSSPADEKIDAEILRALINMIEGLPTGTDGGGGLRLNHDAAIRALFPRAA